MAGNKAHGAGKMAWLGSGPHGKPGRAQDGFNVYVTGEGKNGGKKTWA